MLHALLTIDPQYVDGRPGDWRLADKLRTAPREVIRPAISPRVEETHQFAGMAIVTRGIRAFRIVAVSARPAGILQRR